MSETTLLNNRYELIDRIGTGGMAVVYRARDTRLGRLVAIKMLHESFSHDEVFVRQFQREAHSAAQLIHPNIVTIHDLGQDKGRFYIVMEIVESRTLKKLIREQMKIEEPMSIKRMLNLGIQICKGIGYAHRAGLIHCDVKPQNMLVTFDDRVKVADFGIARAISEATARTTDSVWGTPQYLSPELASGQSPSPASDVYAIGVMLFEMLTNELPFMADTPTAIALKHINEEPPNVQMLNSEVPTQLAAIVHKVLAKEPTGRYRTAEQLGRILASYRDQTAATGPIQIPSGTVNLGRPTRETGPIPELPVDPDEIEAAAEPDLQGDAVPYEVEFDSANGSGQTSDWKPLDRPVREAERQMPENLIIRPPVDENAPAFDRTAVFLTVLNIIAWVGLVVFYAFIAQTYGILNLFG